MSSIPKRVSPERAVCNPVRRIGYCVAALCLLPAGQGVADAVPEVGLAAKMSTRLEMLYTRMVSGAETAPARAPAAPGEAADPWRILKEDRTVLAALSRWAAREGWQVVWELPVDYPVVAEADLGPSFEDAVEQLMRGLQSVTPPPRVVFYAGNRIVRVLPRGVQ